jgi:uncharacterized protein (TIGR02145 family)
MVILFIFIQGCKKDESNDSSNNNYPTIPTVPTMTTTAVNSITLTSVKCVGRIISNGDAEITASGICWGTVPSPTIAGSKTTDGTISGSFTSCITGLTPNTVYYMRAYASNSVGTGYGIERIVKTANSTVTDIDGNTYYTITIGTQQWMMENLKTTKYRNGVAIPSIQDVDEKWDTLTKGAYCNKNNDAAISSTYGKLYNWYAVADTRGIAPTGWHVPSESEWIILENYLGGNKIAGSKLKEAGPSHWSNYNTDADNSSGFMGLPGGSRPYSGEMSNIGISAYWWSSADSNATLAFARHLDIYGAYVERSYAYKGKVGFSVRCVKD